MSETKNSDGSYHYNLFKHMSDTYQLTLLESELQEIANSVRDNEIEKLRAELEKVREECGNLNRQVASNQYDCLKSCVKDLSKWQATAKELAQELADNLAPELQSPALERFNEMEKTYVNTL